jgi:shikimate kinase
MNIYLIGFMGSGKSSTGRKIAASLCWTFADTDKLVEEQEGASVPDIFAQKGEEYFRMAESRALKTVSGKSRTVVACGGGTPCSSDNIEIMRSTGVTVYLKLPVEALTSRLRKSRTVRPLLQGAGEEELTARVQELLARRTEWYEMADLILDGVRDTPEEMTSHIAGLVRSRGSYL